MIKIHPVFIQAFYYGLLMLLTIGLTSFLFKGFFWKYIKVKLSFGRLVMVKIRTPLRDFFKTGFVQDNFLIYKEKKIEKRIVIKDNQVFYRCLGVVFVDLDEEKNALSRTDYKAIDGFDAEKYSNLYTRALMKPAVTSNKEKVMMLLIIGAIVLSGVAAFLSYMALKNSETLISTLATFQSTLENFRGLVVGSASAI